MTRFRVQKGYTSFELMHDRSYAGKLALFGESVMYKDIRALKGEPVYRRGVWVGKSTWSDSHVILTPKGAIECRSIRRLPEPVALLCARDSDAWQGSFQERGRSGGGR